MIGLANCVADPFELMTSLSDVAVEAGGTGVVDRCRFNFGVVRDFEREGRVLGVGEAGLSEANVMSKDSSSSDSTWTVARVFEKRGALDRLELMKEKA